MDDLASSLTYFTDRCLGKQVPNMLAASGWNIESHFAHFADDTKDTELFAQLRGTGWVFLTQDKRMRYRPAEVAGLLEARLRVFYVTTAQKPPSVTVEVFQKARRRIDRYCLANAGPFVVTVQTNGSLHEKSLRPPA